MYTDKPSRCSTHAAVNAVFDGHRQATSMGSGGQQSSSSRGEATKRQGQAQV